MTTTQPPAFTMDEAWMLVETTPEQAAMLFDKLAEMMVDSAPELASALTDAAARLTTDAVNPSNG